LLREDWSVITFLPARPDASPGIGLIAAQLAELKRVYNGNPNAIFWGEKDLLSRDSSPGG
jgi:hypothetical protein